MEDIVRIRTQYADISKMRENTLKLSGIERGKNTGTNTVPGMYVYGNAAVEIEPDIYPEEMPDRKQDSKEERGRRENGRAYGQRRRNREKASGISIIYSLMLAVAAGAALVLCIMYLGVQSEISEKSDYISKLKSNITVLKTNNDSLDFSINSYIDVDNIYKVATEELGMIHATEKQVKLYDSKEPEYMKQIGDITDR